MKAQMKFQKWMCLVMLIVGALGLLYAFFYMSGSMSELGYNVNQFGTKRTSNFIAASGKNDALLYDDMQTFNTIMMYCGIAMILFAVVLYITASNKRRNYYVSNYVATGLCAGGDIVISVILLAMNIKWRGEFLKVDFNAWKTLLDSDSKIAYHYSESTAWFDVGFAVYAIIIIAAVLLILNMVWKIKLMKGEKQLLSNGLVAGGETV